MIKYSKQRHIIKEYIKNSKNHPTAEDIYNNLKEFYPKISLGTIYRNLNILIDIGEITKLTIENNPDRYDYISNEHSHFICTKCSMIFDIEYIPEINHNYFKDIDLLYYSTYFYGFCTKCKNNKEPPNSL